MLGEFGTPDFLGLLVKRFLDREIDVEEFCGSFVRPPIGEFVDYHEKTQSPAEHQAFVDLVIVALDFVPENRHSAYTYSASADDVRSLAISSGAVLAQWFARDGNGG